MGFRSVLGAAIVALTLAGEANALPFKLGAALVSPATNDTLPVRSLGSLSLGSAGFANVISQEGVGALFVSTFQAFGSDAVYRLDNIATAATTGITGFQPTQVPGSVTWPNDVLPVPKSLFGTDGVVVGSGFLVPGKSDGGLYFSASTGGQSSAWVPLYQKSGWFYHRALFADMDGDGVLDLVSCRANKPIFGDAGTMLVWLKPEDPTAPTGPWVETEIGAGCDALFTLADLNGDGIPEVVSTSFFTNSFNVFYSTAKTGFKNSADVTMITIDSTIGAAFDVQYVDVNGDGKPDLLVTNHQGDGTGSVYAYEVPSDITNVKGYTRHTIASNFPVTQGGLNQAAPGSAIAFHPTPASTGGAPHIALAGDAAQLAYILIPGSTPWEYTTTTLHDCGCTVGKLAVADVNGDGYSEIFIPCYDNGVLAAYSFKT